MKTQFFLKLNAKGSASVTKGRPALNWDEVAISVTMDVPDMLFRKPQLNAVISIPESAATPQNIDVEMQDNIREAIESATGLNIRLSVQSEENNA
ncbi:hypothetical protein [Pedobacter agri]|uniref:hypothetical protein n=1 Tax=Pedobacter agri TaxID=454586 RepID=UPI0029313CE1|nr:hypothetical protein [Pedobacter agri]